jgi:hypothetical protein
VVFLKVTRAGGPARRDKDYKNAEKSATEISTVSKWKKLTEESFCSAGVSPVSGVF